MAEPRITIQLSQVGLEIFLNPEGRTLLLEAIARMDAEHEHIHLGPKDGHNDVPLRSTPYGPRDQIVEYAKIYLRLDEWDEQHFPHVMK